jgi:hypothetical protein|tara:strand:- start:512 stop:742 length:231 start_codon:yes stop_codon:yes gene_type:complete
MIHVFLLTVLVSKSVVSNDMYFTDINRCRYFAERIVSSKQRNTGYNPPSVLIEAYCIPALVNPNNTGLKIYKEQQG